MILHYQVYTQEDDNNNEYANINLLFLMPRYQLYTQPSFLIYLHLQ